MICCFIDECFGLERWLGLSGLDTSMFEARIEKIGLLNRTVRSRLARFIEHTYARMHVGTTSIVWESVSD